MSSSVKAKKETNPDANLATIGNYLFQKTVGEGNFAKVKLAKHKITGQEVAIKIIDKTSLDEKKLTKLYREVRIMKMLHHPNIVKLYEVIETRHTIFLVMEYVSGGELYDYLVVHGRMKEKEARAKFRQILSAVNYCHKKRVIHRDLKAENLLLDHNLDIKIADFGFGNQYDPDGKLDTFCGSPPYAAPELFQGKRYTGPEVDVWSLGVILYVLSTGCLPFDGKNLAEMRESVCRGKYRIPFYLSENCEKLLRKFLVRDASKRPGLDVIADDPWLNEGYEETAIAKQPAEEILKEDPLIVQIMETKFHVDHETITNGLRDNVYDDVMAIYFLLYSEKERNGEAAVVKIGDQMAIKNPAVPASPSTPESPRALPPIMPTQAIASIKEEEGGSKEGLQELKQAEAEAVPRGSIPTKSTATNRRSTVASEGEGKKGGAVDEEGETLRKLKNFQVDTKEPAASSLTKSGASTNGQSKEAPAVVPRGPPPVMPHLSQRPMSVASSNEAPILAPLVAKKKEDPNVIANAAATASSSDKKTPEAQRKRTTTITGLLKIRPRGFGGDSTTPATPDASPQPPATALPVDDKDLANSEGSLSGGNDQQPRSLRFTFNSNTTSSKAPDDIMKEVMSACEKHDIKTRLISRFLVECTATPSASFPGAEAVKVEIEVCKLPRLKNLHGLRFKRTAGSSSDYKTVSEKILGSIQL